MEILTRTVLTLLLGHLLADLVFQTNALVQQKKSGRAAGYVKHGAIYFACAAVLMGFFVPAIAYSWRFVAVLLGLTLLHLAIDGSKIRLARRTPLAEGTAAFVVDQGMHFLTIVVAACWLARVEPAGILLHGLNRMQTPSNRVLLALVVYVAVIFGGGYLIRFMTRPLLKHLQTGESRAELSNAGMYIGWLERFLVMTALFLHSPATEGLILAAKSIARYPEFKREQFAEYFLIGTLLSISAATVGGVILLKAFYGSSALPQ
ncbi:MAG TPA: DUF3307 domain-containing protein [Candidatus Acidoferrales bacterium]